MSETQNTTKYFGLMSVTARRASEYGGWSERPMYFRKVYVSETTVTRQDIFDDLMKDATDAMLAHEGPQWKVRGWTLLLIDFQCGRNDL